MGLSERLALSVSAGNLAWSESVTMPVEFVAAMAAATGLGSDLLRAKSHDYAAAKRAVLVLAKKARVLGERKKLHLSQSMAQAMALAALMEIVRPFCRTCTGAGVSVIDELKVTCPACDGIAVHRYDDKERARLCGIPRPDWSQWASRYEMVLSVALRHDCAQAQAGERLG